MAKSITEANMVEIGIISLGKYIFLMICALLTMLLPALVIPEEKIVHKINPEKANTGYSMLSDGTFIGFAKKKVNIIISNSG